MAGISDQQAYAAFDWLNENVGNAAAARAERERAEYNIKLQKSKAFLAATGSVAEREAKAITSKPYIDAVDRYAKAVEADEYYRNNRSKADAIISAWQTVSANQRAMNRVG